MYDRVIRLNKALSVGSVEYTDSISAEGTTPPTNVLYMTLNNLMVKLQ